MNTEIIIFRIIIILSICYGIYEFTSFLYRLWKQAYKHSHSIDDVKTEIENNFRSQISKTKSDLLVELKTYTDQKILESKKTVSTE